MTGDVRADQAAMIEKLLGPLEFRLRSAQQAHTAYLEGQRTFLYAAILYDHNSAARNLALRYGYLLPADLQDDLLKLIFHIDVWMTLWTNLRDCTLPKTTDRFVFANPVPFPRDSVARLSEYLHSLQSKSAPQTQQERAPVLGSRSVNRPSAP
jgi:hypothetical protein